MLIKYIFLIFILRVNYAMIIIIISLNYLDIPMTDVYTVLCITTPRHNSFIYSFVPNARRNHRSSHGCLILGKKIMNIRVGTPRC